MVFQRPNLEQFPPMIALKRGVLWPALYSPYEPWEAEKGD
jgi:spore coat protein JA